MGEGGNSAEEVLVKAKTEAKETLNNYKDAVDYKTNAVELATAITDGGKAIDAATKTEDVTTALNNAKGAIDAIKSDAQLAKEALATAITVADAELEKLTFSVESTIEDATKLATAKEQYSAAKAKVDAAKAKGAVNEDFDSTDFPKLEAQKDEIERYEAVVASEQQLLNSADSAVKVAEDVDHFSEDMKANQTALEVTQKDNTITLEAAELVSFAGGADGETAGEWVAVVIDTGLSSLLDASYDKSAFTDADVEDADSVNAPKGSFVLWVDYAELTEKTFTISSKNGATRTLTLKKAAEEAK